MNAHRVPLDSAPALIDKTTTLLSRIARAAIHARPASRLRLMGELSLVELVLEIVEREIVIAAQHALKAVKRPLALPAPRRALPSPDAKGRKLLPRARRERRKRKTRG